MAKSNNPMQAYHRQKRQKEVKKNKEQRIKARDERVVQTKTVQQLSEEIHNLKRRKNLQSSEQQKLQRLEKELKLVKQVASDQPKSQHSDHQPAEKPLTELDDPRKSIYYDEKLNPYGAPPPGQPRLYHQMGGGTTMDMRLAVVPGEEPSLPPPPPPPPPPHSRHKPSSQSKQADQISNKNAENRARSETSSQAKRIGEDKQWDKARSEPFQEENEIQSRKQEKKPLVVPNLPPPSKAVKRSRRGKATVDIWASNEEVEYERRANQIDLEADDIAAALLKNKKSKEKRKKPPLEIFYQDQSGIIQGPFPKSQMQAWFAQGFFPESTMVKTNRKDEWVFIGELAALKQDSPKDQEGASVADRIAALKGEPSAEDRSSAEMQDHTSVEDRIAALKKDACQPDAESEKAIEQVTSIEDRIRAIRAAKVADESSESLPPPPPPPAPGPGKKVSEHASSIEDRIRAIRAAKASGELSENLPPPPPPPPPPPAAATGPKSFGGTAEDDDDPAVAPYPIEDSIPGVAAYPIMEEPPMYPVDEEVGAYVYPTGDCGDDENHAIGAYPVEENGGNDYPMTESYPVTDNYPDETQDAPKDDTPDALPMYPVGPANETKKTVKIDKALVTFMPSQLRNNKRKSTQSGIASKKPKVPPQKSMHNDYEQFMKELEDIGT